MIKQLLNGEWNLTYREIDDENRKISLSIRALLEDDGYISNNDSEDAGKAEADEQPAADESTEA